MPASTRYMFARGHTPTACPPPSIAHVANLATSSIVKKSPSVSTSNCPKAAPANVMAHVTAVQDVDQSSTALLSALTERQTKLVTPLLLNGWSALMVKHQLVNKYPNILSTLQHGMIVGVQPILHSFLPPNKPSIAQYTTTFHTILQHEYLMHWQLGPFTRAQLEMAIGPCQSSLLSIILKPNKPGKYQLIQDFSFPYSPTSPIPSINTSLDSSLFPCTWGTFSTMALCIAQLPPGAQAATRDESEAYRSIPLHLSQWSSTVLRVSEDAFNIDT